MDGAEPAGQQRRELVAADRGADTAHGEPKLEEEISPSVDRQETDRRLKCRLRERQARVPRALSVKVSNFDQTCHYPGSFNRPYRLQKHKLNYRVELLEARTEIRACL